MIQTKVCKVSMYIHLYIHVCMQECLITVERLLNIFRILTKFVIKSFIVHDLNNLFALSGFVKEKFSLFDLCLLAFVGFVIHYINNN